MRCLNLAQALAKKGVSVKFICRGLDGNISERVLQSGFTVCELDNKTDLGFILDQHLDAMETIQTVIKSNALGSKPIVIVDHYGAGIEWQSEVRQKFPLMVIDDLADHNHNCDILLNQNLYPEGKDLYKGLINSDAQILIGPFYALLSDHFPRLRPQSPTVRTSAERIVVSFGGSDLDNNTLKAIKSATHPSYDAIRVDVVIGKNHPDKESLQQISSLHRNVFLHSYIENFAEFLTGCDIMIGAGGVTQWERCCLGIPGIILSIAENQTRIAANIANMKAGIYLGWHQDVTIEHIRSALDTLISDISLRQEMAEAACALTDGKGAQRAADIILATAMRLRPATESDIDLVFKWRNHEDIRRHSHNEQIIDYADHRKWMEKSLNNPDRHILIAERADEPIGVLRFDFEGTISVISVYLGPEFIGQGLGSVLLKMGTDWIRNNKPGIETIRASIKETNYRSQKAFLAAGYSDCGHYYEINMSQRSEA